MKGASTNRPNSLHVGIDAQLVPHSGFGGTEHVMVGLISALGKLDDGKEEYTIVTHHEHPDWLKPYVGPNQRIVRGWKPGRSLPRKGEETKRTLGPLRPLARKLYRSVVPPKPWEWAPRSDGFYEGFGCRVVHFPYPVYCVCKVPIIFNPHDLQHLHYPDNFKPDIIEYREGVYRGACAFAHTVVAGSQWVKEDLIAHYKLPPDKIQVIPWAPPTQAYKEPTEEVVAAVRDKHRLLTGFAFFPAMTWPHKNHIRLLEAIALLRDRHNLRVNLVCTGKQNEFWPSIKNRIGELRLEDQVQFLDLVPAEELRAIYRLATFVVIPTLFEAASGPLFEAWQEGVPAACSTVTSLPEQAGDAALLFDPYSVKAIADAVAKLATDAALRDDLRARGQHRLRDFSWERTAKAYRAVYRRAAKHPLSDEDRQLLAWDWMSNAKMEVSV
jgi:glycosyltransferase involved in cell wall biosynthesis